jgi:hypothetical protein
MERLSRALVREARRILARRETLDRKATGRPMK